MRLALAERYGPTGLVVGASEGLGAAWARALGAGGLDLVLVARRPDPLETTAAAVRATADVAVTALPGDLRRPEEWLAGVGFPDLVVLNAAVAPTGPFFASPTPTSSRRRSRSTASAPCGSPGRCCPPGYAAEMAAGAAPGTLPAERVVEVALAALGRKPAVVPGRINALAVLLGRLAPARSPSG